ncbi:hypothetical protein B0J11DRAFT_505151 [Dendryphion nanum]|uniref:RRN7-type domain-containing protein n=1 Tax=Dendryphion nanum TaxID=256645 RepID=A0A9P9E088_9PLEO|nr:hypothetical protein B0J11DRAFT_505151 [Dendryphion nanum]
MEHRAKGQRCGIDNCRSRLYDEGEDGYLYCENGHRQGEQLIAAADDGDFLGGQRRDRTRKRTDNENEQAGSKQLKGKSALNLYLKSLQLILRRQLWFLTHEQGLPAELEMVVFDLWALRVLQLETKFTESQVYDSQSEFLTSESEGVAKTNAMANSRELKLKTTPNLLDCLALCYLGIITLRLPITPGDIHAWVIDGKLVYWTALKLLPHSMVERLPGPYHAHLSPNSIFKLQRFYSTLSSLGVIFQKEYALEWPRLNHPPLLFRYIKELALPLEIYTATVSLIKYLDYSLELPKRDQGRLGVRHFPEAQLVACFVVCVKLLYPFDRIDRYPSTDDEPAATKIRWSDWYEHLSTAKLRREGDPMSFTTHDLMNVKEKDIFSMSDNQLDQYMDWYQDNLLNPHSLAGDGQSDFRDALYKFFPIETTHIAQPPRLVTQSLPHREALRTVNEVHQGIESSTVVVEEHERPDIVRPGQQYAYYRHVEDLPIEANRFYEEVARLAGLDLEMLVMAVFFAEKRVEKRRVAQKQQARAMEADLE